MLKQLLILILSYCAFMLNAQSNIDVLHYKFNIELNDNNDTIDGTSHDH